MSTCIGIDEGTCRHVEAETIRVIQVKENDDLGQGSNGGSGESYWILYVF